jgi:hypothetical protein
VIRTTAEGAPDYRPGSIARIRRREIRQTARLPPHVLSADIQWRIGTVLRGRSTKIYQTPRSGT